MAKLLVQLSTRGFLCITSSLSVSMASLFNTYFMHNARSSLALVACLNPNLGQSAATTAAVQAAGMPSLSLRSSSMAAFSVGNMAPSIWGRNKQSHYLAINDGGIRRMSTSQDVELTNNAVVGVVQNRSDTLDSRDDDDDDDTTNNAKTKLIENVEERYTSLANLASSPERFAEALNMTPHQVNETIQARKAASAALNERLIAFEKENEHTMSAGEIGRIKHQMICRHRYDNLRRPWICRKCWTHVPICVCPLFERDDGALSSEKGNSLLNNAEKERSSKAPLPKGIDRVVLWTHHEEWGRTSNTGSLLPLGLERTEMLMKGLPEHDEIMDDLLSRDDLTPVVLWPGKGQGNNATTTIPELQRKFAENGDGCNNSINNTKPDIVLISIEGTWNTARKMVNKLPSKVLRLDLGDEVAANFSTPEMNAGIFCNSSYPSPFPPPNESEALSLLAPLRRQKHGKRENVSTAEATIVALLGLGLGHEDAGRILRVLRTKVDRLLQYSGKTTWRK